MSEGKSGGAPPHPLPVEQESSAFLGTSRQNQPSSLEVLDRLLAKVDSEPLPPALAEAVASNAELLREVPRARPGLLTTEPGSATAPEVRAEPLPQLLTVRAVRVLGEGRVAVLRRGCPEPVDADVAPEVSPELLEVAVEQGQSLLVEWAQGASPLVVGVIQTCVPSQLKLRAESIQLEASEEILFRSGAAALRLRSDGDIEMVGGRISAASRGLFRLVGRMLRLN